MRERDRPSGNVAPKEMVPEVTFSADEGEVFTGLAEVDEFHRAQQREDLEEEVVTQAQ